MKELGHQYIQYDKLVEKITTEDFGALLGNEIKLSFKGNEQSRKRAIEDQIERKHEVKRYVSEQLQRRGQISSNKNFGITKQKILSMLEEG